MEGNHLNNDQIYFHLPYFWNDSEKDPFTLIDQKTKELKKKFPERKFSWYVTTTTTWDDLINHVKTQIKCEIIDR